MKRKGGRPSLNLVADGVLRAVTKNETVAEQNEDGTIQTVAVERRGWMCAGVGCEHAQFYEDKKGRPCLNATKACEHGLKCPKLPAEVKQKLLDRGSAAVKRQHQKLAEGPKAKVPKTGKGLTKAALALGNGAGPRTRPPEFVNQAELPWSVVPGDFSQYGPVLDSQSNRYPIKGRKKALGQGSKGPSSKGLGCSLCEVEPGQSLFPFHYNLGTKEAVYVLEGQGTCVYGWPDPTNVAVGQGDYIDCAVGQQGAIQIVNTGTTTLRYLSIEKGESPNVCVFPEHQLYNVGATTPRVDGVGEDVLCAWFKAGHAISLQSNVQTPRAVGAAGVSAAVAASSAVSAALGIVPASAAQIAALGGLAGVVSGGSGDAVQLPVPPVSAAASLLVGAARPPPSAALPQQARTVSNLIMHQIAAGAGALGDTLATANGSTPTPAVDMSA